MLSVVEAGQGPAVLLGHGYLWNWRMWEPQVAALARRYRADFGRFEALSICHAVHSFARLQHRDELFLAAALGALAARPVSSRAKRYRILFRFLSKL